MEALGLKCFSLANECRTQWNQFCANLQANSGSVIEHFLKCYRTAGDIILNTGTNDLVLGCVGWHKTQASCQPAGKRRVSRCSKPYSRKKSRLIMEGKRAYIDAKKRFSSAPDHGGIE